MMKTDTELLDQVGLEILGGIVYEILTSTNDTHDTVFHS